jgi:hypothetical protein
MTDDDAYHFYDIENPYLYIGCCQIFVSESGIEFKNFIHIDVLFFKHLKFETFIPDLNLGPYQIMDHSEIPPNLMKFFKTICWNIQLQDFYYDDVMTSTEGMFLRMLELSEKEQVFNSIFWYGYHFLFSVQVSNQFSKKKANRIYII